MGFWEVVPKHWGRGQKWATKTLFATKSFVVCINEKNK